MGENGAQLVHNPGNNIGAQNFANGRSGINLPKHRQNLTEAVGNVARHSPPAAGYATIAATALGLRALQFPAMDSSFKSLLRTMVHPPRFAGLSPIAQVGTALIKLASAVALPKFK